MSLNLYKLPVKLAPSKVGRMQSLGVRTQNIALALNMVISESCCKAFSIGCIFGECDNVLK